MRGFARSAGFPVIESEQQVHAVSGSLRHVHQTPWETSFLQADQKKHRELTLYIASRYSAV